MRKKMMNLKEANFLTKKELKTIHAGDLLDCEEGHSLVDRICRPDMGAIGDDNPNIGSTDNCHMY